LQHRHRIAGLPIYLLGGSGFSPGDSVLTTPRIFYHKLVTNLLQGIRGIFLTLADDPEQSGNPTQLKLHLQIYENSSSVYSESFFLTCANHGCSHPDIGRSDNGFGGGIVVRFWARYFKDRP
jgi:hypothetical protein